MSVILVPGFWLGSWSWQKVADRLASVGHAVRALTLPGLDSLDSSRQGVGLEDHIEALLAEIDRSDPADGPVVLVAHNGGAAVVHAAVDRRSYRISRAVYIDAVPLSSGSAAAPTLPEVDGELPLPDWRFFPERDLIGLDESARTLFRQRAVPTPTGVARDVLTLSDARRFLVPVTVIATTLAAEQMRLAMARGDATFGELAANGDATIVDLPTGHWPQFSRPDDLAELVLATTGPAHSVT